MRELGLAGFFVFQGHFAGVILAALIYPASYILIAYDAMMGWLLSQPHSILDYHILVITVFNLVAGFTGPFVLGFFVLKKRHLAALLPQIPLIPLYWLLILSAAVWISLNSTPLVTDFGRRLSRALSAFDCAALLGENRAFRRRHVRCRR
jgi:hypothetical protein